METLRQEIETYLKNCGESPHMWDIETMAWTLWRLDYKTLSEVPEITLTCELIGNKFEYWI